MVEIDPFGAKRGDLECGIICNHRDSSMLGAGLMRCVARSNAALFHLLPRSSSSEIEIVKRAFEQEVAHEAADQPSLVTCGFKQVDHRDNARRYQLVRARKRCVFERRRPIVRPAFVLIRMDMWHALFVRHRLPFVG